MSTTPTVDDRRRQEFEEDARYIAGFPPLPTAEDLAEPILEGFYGVFEVTYGNGRTESLCRMVERAEFDDSLDVAEYRAQLVELVELAERTAQLVRVGIAGLLPGGPDRVAEIAALDAVIRSILETAHAERVLVGRIADRLQTRRSHAHPTG